jgi:hypothetical protein
MAKKAAINVRQKSAAAKAASSKKLPSAGKIKIMIGSAVYGYEDQLSAIVAELRILGYEVLNSHIGSMRVNPRLSNLENCLNAVGECDLFLGIIRPYCGTGNIGEKNITFEEIKEAIRLEKPYWFLVHRDVVFARNLLKKIKKEKGSKIELSDNKFFDLLSISMYEYVIKNHLPVTLRNGNWAQEFYRLDDMMTYILAQFSSKEFIKDVIKYKQKHNG